MSMLGLRLGLGLRTALVWPTPCVFGLKKLLKLLLQYLVVVVSGERAHHVWTRGPRLSPCGNCSSSDGPWLVWKSFALGSFTRGATHSSYGFIPYERRVGVMRQGVVMYESQRVNVSYRPNDERIYMHSKHCGANNERKTCDASCTSHWRRNVSFIHPAWVTGGKYVHMIYAALIADQEDLR